MSGPARTAIQIATGAANSTVQRISPFVASPTASGSEARRRASAGNATTETFQATDSMNSSGIRCATV